MGFLRRNRKGESAPAPTSAEQPALTFEGHRAVFVRESGRKAVDTYQMLSAINGMEATKDTAPNSNVFFAGVYNAVSTALALNDELGRLNPPLTEGQVGHLAGRQAAYSNMIPQPETATQKAEAPTDTNTTKTSDFKG